MWDVHALVEQAAVLGRSRRDGRGEGVLMVQTYSREHSNWVALMAWRFGASAHRRARSASYMPSTFRRLRDGVCSMAWRLPVCRRYLVPPDLQFVSVSTN